MLCSCHTWHYPPPAAKCFKLNFSVRGSIKAFFRPSCIFCKKSFQVWCNCNHSSLTYPVFQNWTENWIISLTSLTLVSLLNWFWISGTNDSEGWLPSYLLPEKEPISSTDKPVEKNEDDHMDFPIPRRLTVEEIPNVINHFRVAARNAVDAGKLIVNIIENKKQIRKSTTLCFQDEIYLLIIIRCCKNRI